MQATSITRDELLRFLADDVSSRELIEKVRSVEHGLTRDSQPYVIVRLDGGRIGRLIIDEADFIEDGATL